MKFKNLFFYVFMIVVFVSFAGCRQPEMEIQVMPVYAATLADHWLFLFRRRAAISWP